MTEQRLQKSPTVVFVPEVITLQWIHSLFPIFRNRQLVLRIVDTGEIIHEYRLGRFVSEEALEAKLKNALVDSVFLRVRILIKN